MIIGKNKLIKDNTKFEILNFLKDKSFNIAAFIIPTIFHLLSVNLFKQTLTTNLLVIIAILARIMFLNSNLSQRKVLQIYLWIYQNILIKKLNLLVVMTVTFLTHFYTT